MKRVVYICLLFVGFSSSAQESLDALLKVYNTQSVPYISVEELRRLQLHEEVIILDAREIEETDVSIIPKALYVGYSEFSSEITSEKIEDKNATIVVYCSLGVRSEEIGEKLQKAGYQNVKNLYGGIFEWKNKGYPVWDTDGNETENVHVCAKTWGKWLTRGKKIF